MIGSLASLILSKNGTLGYIDALARDATHTMKQAALDITKELQASKIADKQLTISPIDDHGDIDPRKDFLNCVSKADRKYFPLLDAP